MQTMSLRTVHSNLAKDTSDSLSALRDAALNNENSPEETRPPCVFRSRNAVSQWLPHSFIVKACWRPDADDANFLDGTTCFALSSRPGQVFGGDEQLQSHAGHAHVDALAGNDVESVSINCHELGLQMALQVSKRTASAMMTQPEEDLPTKGGAVKHIRTDQDAAPQCGSSHHHNTMQPKQQCVLPAALQISQDDEKLLKSEGQDVSKFSASCIVEPWLSKHCSMFGVDFVRQAIHERIQGLRQQT